MTWQALPTAYLLVPLIVAGSLIVIATYKQRNVMLPGPLVMLMISSTVWALANLLVLASGDLPTKLFWNKIEFMGVIGVPIGWFLLALDITGYRSRLNLRNLLLLAAVPLACMLLAFTNEYHGWLWADMAVELRRGLLMLTWTRGPAVWLFIIHSYVVVTVGAFLVIRLQIREGAIFRARGRVVLLAAIAGVSIALLETASSSLSIGIDVTPLVILILTPITFEIASQLRYSDLAPMARERIIEELTDAVIVVDHETTIRDLNPAAEVLMKTSQARALGHRLAKLWPQSAEILQKLAETPAGPTDIVLKNGKQARHYEMNWTSLYEPGRQNASIIILTFHDITHRHQAALALEQSLQEKELLLREIHHRVKNNLQVISSLLNLEIAHTDQVDEDALLKSQIRIRSMALIHEQLYRSKNLGSIELPTYLREILSYFRQSYDAQQITFDLHADSEITLDIDTAIPVGLIICEAVSNALKHAFPNHHGAVLIDLQSHSNAVHITISDNGIGLPQHFEDAQTNTLGFTLIQGLARQIDAQLNVTNTSGVQVSLRIPLNETIPGEK